MKKLKTQYAIILIITAYFLFNGCVTRESEISVQYGCLTFYNFETYAEFLHEEGWNIKLAEHIAKVEFKILPVDEEYTALIED